MPTLAERIKAYPPLLKIVMAALAVLAVGLQWHHFVWTQAESWNNKLADDLALVEEATAAQRSLGVQLQKAIVAIGEIDLPGDQGASVDELGATISAVLQKHHVTGEDVRNKGMVKLPRGLLDGLIREGQAAWEISNEIKFEATPDVAIAVVKDLEGSPQIEAVTSVRLLKSSGPGRGGSVSVNITVTAWYIPTGAAEPQRRNES